MPINDQLAAMCTAHPARFIGLATLPLGNVPAALVELDRAIGSLGLKGVAIGSNVSGVDRALVTFTAKEARRRDREPGVVK